MILLGHDIFFSNVKIMYPNFLALNKFIQPFTAIAHKKSIINEMNKKNIILQKML